MLWLDQAKGGGKERHPARCRRRIWQYFKDITPETRWMRALGLCQSSVCGRSHQAHASRTGSQEQRMEEMTDQPGAGTRRQKGELDSIVWRGKRIVDMTRDELEQAFQQLAATHQREMMKHIRQLAEMRNSRR